MIADKSYDPQSPQRIAFIGLGTMGAPMAAHLCKAGHELRVYNRTRSKADAWAQQWPGRVAATPAEAALGADLVVSCVGNDDDLRQVCLGPSGALATLAEGGVWVDHTTTSAEVAREMAAIAQERSRQFIDAPVSGGNLGAINGALTIMCGGDPAAFERIRPVVGSYARAVTWLGPAGAGQLAKMVNQICVAGLVQGLAEGIAFGQQAGLDMHRVIEVISQGAASSWQMIHRGPTMVDDRFDFGFAVDWMRKDLGLCLDEARRQGATLPVTALIDQFYADVQRMGGGRWDTSSLIRRLRDTDPDAPAAG